MAESPYRLIGGEMSPYSVKARAYLRYKNVPHVWLNRADHEKEFQKHARLPLVPLLITPDGEPMQDSTPILDYIDAHFPDPATHPDDEVLRFLSLLIEEYGDEWGNKLMFHHRWWDEVDQLASARALAHAFNPDADAETLKQTEQAVKARMSGRGDFVGSNEGTKSLIERYLSALLDILEAHLADRPYLFGGRPAFGDFGLAAQLYEAALDPTAGGIIRARFPQVLDWCYRMQNPRNDGAWESWDALETTLMPLVENIGKFFLPWSAANAEALAGEQPSFTVALPDGDYTQPPQKYHARSLSALREKYAAAATPALDAVLEKGDALRWLR